MKKSEKEFCASNLAAMIIEDQISSNNKNNHYEIMNDFLSSNTFKKLCDVENRLWAEGPAYIKDMYLIEKSKK